MKKLRKKLNSVAVKTMEINGYKAQLMKARRLKSKSDKVHGLPAGVALKAVPVSCLPGAPEDWMRADGSYVIEVDSEMGLWFDWTSNDGYHTAIVPSVKGMNPITGQKIEGLSMEKYKGKCPVHDCEFLPDRLCEECGYKWPAQNFVSSPNTLWWDGFRQPDGSVRQFFFTEDDNRDVATHVMGKKSTVPAFGFAFYKYKGDRRPYGHNIIWTTEPYQTGPNINKLNPGWKFEESSDVHIYTNYTLTTSSTSSSSSQASCSAELSSCDARGLESSPLRSKISGGSSFKSISSEERRRKDVSVGAGAKIAQEIIEDSADLDNWEKEPDGIIRLYFVFKEKMDEILKKGGVEFPNGDPEGYLSNIPVG